MLSQASQYLLAELQRDEQRDALVSGTGKSKSRSLRALVIVLTIVRL